MKKVILNFDDKTKLHIEDKLLEYIPSDKIYSFIINIISNIYSEEKLNKFIQNINEKVLISSAFLGIEISTLEVKKRIDFLPKPYILIKSDESDVEDSIDNRKKYKKIAYISNDTFKKISNNYKEVVIEKKQTLDEKPNIKRSINYNLAKGLIIGKNYYVEKEEIAEFLKYREELESYSPLKHEVIQRNFISRYNKESLNTYYEEFKVINYMHSQNLSIRPYFYFYLDDKEYEIEEEILKTLEFNSIGGKRSLGAGLVKSIEIEHVDDFVSNSNGNVYMNISSVYPIKDDVKHMTSYLLEERNGYIFSKRTLGIRKPKIRHIKEGSIFDDKVKGVVNEFKIEGLHSVYIYGKAMLLPIGGDR